MSRLILKQPMFNWKAGDKYEELQNLELEVSNMLQNYTWGQTEKVPVINNWQGRGSATHSNSNKRIKYMQGW